MEPRNILDEFESIIFGYEKIIALLDVMQETVANGAVEVRGLRKNTFDYLLYDAADKMCNYTEKLKSIMSELCSKSTLKGGDAYKE